MFVIFAHLNCCCCIVALQRLCSRLIFFSTSILIKLVFVREKLAELVKSVMTIPCTNRSLCIVKSLRNQTGLQYAFSFSIKARPGIQPHVYENESNLQVNEISFSYVKLWPNGIAS